MLRIQFSTHASRQYEKIREHKVRERIAEALEALAADPLGGKPLHGPLAGCRSLRTGDYRIVYQIQAKERLLGIVRIDHRREVYR
jgi:mRNA interferase RelE/StbE